MTRILFVEDDPGFARLIELFLVRKGYALHVCHSVKDAIRETSARVFDLLLLDYRLPDGTGLDVIRAARIAHGAVPAIIITSLNDIRTAVKAMQAGAFDYITKPVNHEELLMALRDALKTSADTQKDLRPPITKVPSVKGHSKVARELYKLTSLVAPTDMTVVIVGESGTGKEHIARTIHAHSQRHDKAFVAIDCGMQSSELAVSELFGYEQGAYTGAVSSKKGKFVLAHGGTLFLDEIGNLNYEVQIKLLRTLQERVITPLGSNQEIPIDVRILAATNESLSQLVQADKFREDLYHRLNEFTLHVPALRQRLEDLPEFVDYFIREANRDLKKNVQGLREETWKVLKEYDWPGNLRELRNIIRRAILLTDSELIGNESLPPDLVLQLYHIPNSREEEDLRSQRSNVEREAIIEALRACQYNKSKTAKVLNIDRKTLYNKMKQYGITT
jgi:two-component system response regulator HydG